MKVKYLLHRAVVLVAVVGVAALVPAAPATAIAPYTYDPAVDVAPDDAPPGPDFPMKQQYLCATSGRLEGSQFDSVPIDTVWQVDKLHDYATGMGQTVAVIDSGVNRNDRLPRLFGGGDYIMGGDGLQDCDHHGTLVAGIIGAAPRPGDGFVGIAPDVSILSIRQASERYQVDSSQTRNAEQVRASSNVGTLAKAIVHAAALNATVINISVTACVDVGMGTDLHELAGALHYAAVVKDAVIVTSAGNLGGDCEMNPGPDPAHPDDPRGWGSAQTLSLPSLFTDYVLSVGGTGLTGDPYTRSMPGPWVGVGAPATSVVSLDPAKTDGSLVNAKESRDGIEPIAGTSFASANVAGLAALIRQRYPRLTAHQVIERIKRTSHHASESLATIIGDGVVDPLAALTAPVDDSLPMVAANIPPVAAVAGESLPPEDHLARNLAFVALGVLGFALFVLSAVAIARGGSKNKESV